MRKVLFIFVVLALLLTACSVRNPSDHTFTVKDNGNLLSPSGIEYEHLANEGFLYYLGELEYVGNVQGEEKISQHLGLPYETGLFSLKNAEKDNILIRYMPNNEWFSVYRKASLPSFDFSAENCIRFEYVPYPFGSAEQTEHLSCGKGISGQAEISDFLSELRKQETAHEAGLYELIEKPNGMLENCYVCGVIYGFFEEEPNLVLRMNVTSFNDLAYSVSFEEQEYVMPVEWMQKLQNQ